MTFDLYVLPVDRALTFEEASALVDRPSPALPFGLGHDRRLDPFIGAMERRYGRLRGAGAIPPFEFDVSRSSIFIGVPWSTADEVTTTVAAAAWEAGLAVVDPQRGVVGLPAPFADGPLTSEGVEVHVAQAGEALAAVEQGVALAADGSEGTAGRSVPEQVRSSGFRITSPLGFEITPDLEAEALGDPLRMPTSLQTPEHKAELMADLAATAVGPRHRALARLAAWDPDPEVAAALRSLLASEDVYEAGQAASGLARQRDITDLPAVMAVLHRLSPADGASAETMLVPLRAALALAALAGPEIVEGVRARARAWRGARPVRRQSWEREFDRDLDDLLGPE